MPTSRQSARKPTNAGNPTLTRTSRPVRRGVSRRPIKIRPGVLLSDRLRHSLESGSSQKRAPFRFPSKKAGRPWLPLSLDSPVFCQLNEIDEAYPAEPDDIERLITAVQQGRYKLQPRAGRLAIIQAIDETSGDSVLHTIARQASYEAYLDLLGEFSHPFSEWHDWAEHALVTHENHAGDTVLHVAARKGDQKLCTTIYRHFQAHWTALIPDLTDADKDVPELREYPDDFLPDGSDPSLRFIIMTNKAGNTAEDEARASNQEGVAQWLHDVRKRLDPDGTRVTEVGITILNRVVAEKYRYIDTIAEDYH